ncbi:MAG: hypothetical protein HC848_05080 [Limnobacter sp.]|nr:hypothetical protein [Limnobacter sp.]
MKPYTWPSNKRAIYTKAVHATLRFTRKALASGAVYALLAFGGNIAWATSANPPSEAVQAIPGLKKLGEGKLSWWGLSIYDSQLWGTATGQTDFKPNSYWLELQYKRSFKGSEIAKKSREEIQDQHPYSPQKLDAWQAELTRIFPEVVKGDTLSALYLPGQPMRFWHNNKPLATLADPELATAFMGIWLDPKTSDPELRAKLLGL